MVYRQPILDLCERIVAFELLTPAVSAGEATASVLAQAIAEWGCRAWRATIRYTSTRS